VLWYEEPLDPQLLAGVQRILAPVMNKQWDYDMAVERLNSKPRAVPSPVSNATPAGVGPSCNQLSA
jgi:hypothetical protein